MAESPLRVEVARLSPYRDVERSATHLFLAREARRSGPEVYVDLAFFPGRAERRELEQAGRPLLAGSQSGRPVAEFDLVLLSNSYLLELINLPFLLLRSKLPLLASERPEGCPPLILGGSNALAAQAILTGDGGSFADALFFGEGEERVDRLIRLYRASRAATRRERLLEAAAQVEGLWVAGAPGQRVRKAVARPAGGGAGLWGAPVGSFPVPDGAEAATARLQITYGCPGRCAFCFEGGDRRPFRAVPVPALLGEARALKRESGADTLEILSFNFNTHPQIVTLLAELNRLFLRVNWMSQRLDVLAATPGLLRAEVLAGKRGFTLGIEGVSRRMRDFLAKSLEPAVIERLFRDLLREKAREVKLFCQLTGHETAADFAELEALAQGMRRAARELNPGTRVIFSFNRLLRLPFTPLRHDRLILEEAAWAPLIRRAEAICRQAGFEFRIASDWNEYWTAQVMALGGPWLSGALERMARAGLCYEDGLPAAARAILEKEMGRRGIALPDFSAARPEGHPFPLEWVEGGPGAPELWRRWRAARAALASAPGRAHRGAARPGEARLGVALEGEPAAGAPAAEAGPEEAAPPARPEPPEAAALDRLAALMKAKERLPALTVQLTLPRAAAGATPEWRGAWAARELYRLHPGLLDRVLAVREVPLFADPPAGGRVPLFGRAIFEVTAWEPDAVRQELAAATRPALPPAPPSPAGDLPPMPPGGFDQAVLEATLPGVGLPEAGRWLAGLLDELHVRATVRREGSGYRLEVAPGSAKKRVVLGGRYEPAAGGTAVALQAGPKFSLAAWTRRAGRDGPPALEVREIRLPPA